MKVYKSNNKLILYLPFEVTKQLGLKGDEEVDFFKFNEKAFLFAKKEDIKDMLVGAQQPKERIASGPRPQGRMDLSQGEIDVLKKMDTLRYAQRTTANVAKLLGDSEKKVLQGLLDKKSVELLKDGKEGLYSISKDVYDRFLMRKKIEAPQKAEPAKPAAQERRHLISYKKIAGMQNEVIEKLEKNGFVVLATEAEAASVSLALQDSVRLGLVLGTRAFNKKFYIILRDFFNEKSGAVIKSLKDGPKGAEAVAKDAGVDEDAVRAILYLLSEQGDVSERRKDVFALV